jgi:PAS domain S-box-containing protein
MFVGMKSQIRKRLGTDPRARVEIVDELDAIYLLSDDMICVASSDGYFRRVSPAWERNLGHSREALTSKPWLDFVHPDDRATTIEAARSLTSADLVAFENRYRHADGSYRVVRWKALQWSAGLTYAVARIVTRGET